MWLFPEKPTNSFISTMFPRHTKLQSALMWSITVFFQILLFSFTRTSERYWPSFFSCSALAMSSADRAVSCDAAMSFCGFRFLWKDIKNMFLQRIKLQTQMGFFNFEKYLKSCKFVNRQKETDKMKRKNEQMDGRTDGWPWAVRWGRSLSEVEELQADRHWRWS